MPRGIDPRGVNPDREPGKGMGGPIPDFGQYTDFSDTLGLFIDGLLKNIKDWTGIDLFWMLDWSWTTNSLLELIRQANDLTAWLQNPIQKPPNLLSRPGFSSPSAIAAAPDWSWDPVVSLGTVEGPYGVLRTDPQGSARTIADGSRHSMLSKPISEQSALTPGQILTCQMHALVEAGFTASDDEAILLELVPSRLGVPQEPVVLAACGVPTGDPTDWIAAPVDSKAVFFDVDWTVPTTDSPDTVELRPVVSESAGGGVPVRFDGARVSAAGGFLVVLADLFDAGRIYLTALWDAITAWLEDVFDGEAWTTLKTDTDAAWVVFVRQVKRALHHADADLFHPPNTSDIISSVLKNNKWFGWLIHLVDDWLQPFLLSGKALSDFGAEVWQAVTTWASDLAAPDAWPTLLAAITSAWNDMVDAALVAWGSLKTHEDFASPVTVTEEALRASPLTGWLFDVADWLGRFINDVLILLDLFHLKYSASDWDDALADLQSLFGILPGVDGSPNSVDGIDTLPPTRVEGLNEGWSQLQAALSGDVARSGSWEWLARIMNTLGINIDTAQDSADSAGNDVNGINHNQAFHISLDPQALVTFPMTGSTLPSRFSTGQISMCANMIRVPRRLTVKSVSAVLARAGDLTANHVYLGVGTIDWLISTVTVKWVSEDIKSQLDDFYQWHVRTIPSNKQFTVKPGELLVPFLIVDGGAVDYIGYDSYFPPLNSVMSGILGMSAVLDGVSISSASESMSKATHWMNQYSPWMAVGQQAESTSYPTYVPPAGGGENEDPGGSPTGPPDNPPPPPPPPIHAPQTVTVSSTGTVPIPSWVVPGDKVDLVALGAGGGCGGGFGGTNGVNGGATVGRVNGSTVVTGPGGARGLDGQNVSTADQYYGKGAQPYLFNGESYYGGGAVMYKRDGTIPGGGGGGTEFLGFYSYGGSAGSWAGVTRTIAAGDVITAVIGSGGLGGNYAGIKGGDGGDGRLYARFWRP